MKLKVEAFYDQATFTLTYVVFDPESKDAIVIDPVMDYDQASSQVTFHSLEKVLNFVKQENLNLQYVLETHAHADHLTGAAEIRRRVDGVKVGIGERITQVQDLFKGVFNYDGLKTTGEQFDTLLNESENLKVGTIEVKTIFTPGHTPACASFLIEDMLFTGDALFMPDFGTGRCDFPAGSAADLYDSIHGKLYQLPDETRVFTGHDYQPGGRKLEYESTIGKNKKENVWLKVETTKEEFVAKREARDKNLEAPRLLLPSVQVNINAGDLPPAETNGTSYLKIPIQGAK
jgi:glyoxylase-like metal-dependent hydrolase (beta-lactamase superfamily II)